MNWPTEFDESKLMRTFIQSRLVQLLSLLGLLTTVNSQLSNALAQSTAFTTGGFWSLIAADQTPGAPGALYYTIEQQRDRFLAVAFDWICLTESATIANPNGWSFFTGTINDNGTIKSVTISPTGGNLYFRLKQ